MSTTANGSSMCSMKTRPMTLMTPTVRPSARARQVAAVARRAGGVVGRAQQPRLGADVVERLLLVPDVVARRSSRRRPSSSSWSPISRVMPKPAAAFSALAMTRSTLMVVDERRQAAAHELAARAADDVADEEDAHQCAVDRYAESELAAALGDLRQRDAQLAVPTSVARALRRVARTSSRRMTRANRP